MTTENLQSELPRYYHVLNSSIKECGIDNYRAVLNVSVDYPEMDHLVTLDGLKLYHMVDGRMLLRDGDEPIQGELETMTIIDYINKYPVRGKYINCISNDPKSKNMDKTDSEDTASDEPIQGELDHC